MSVQHALTQLDYILTPIVWHFFAIAELEFRRYRYVHSHFHLMTSLRADEQIQPRLLSLQTMMGVVSSLATLLVVNMQSIPQSCIRH